MTQTALEQLLDAAALPRSLGLVPPEQYEICGKDLPEDWIARYTMESDSLVAAGFRIWRLLQRSRNPVPLRPSGRIASHPSADLACRLREYHRCV
jgi:hypothetical protein